LDDRVGEMGGVAKAGLVRGASDGINRVVLEEQELVGDRAGSAFGDELLLELERLLVREAAEPVDDGGWQFLNVQE
jgi:hypothetical protein